MSAAIRVARADIKRLTVTLGRFVKTVRQLTRVIRELGYACARAMAQTDEAFELDPLALRWETP